MLKQVDNNIWFSTGRAQLLGAESDNKMFIIRNNKNELLIISPLAPTEELLKEVNELGEVITIVSPNPFHYLHLLDFWAKYPKASCIASPGLKKRKPYSYDHLKDFEFDLFDDFPQIELFNFDYKNEWKEIIFFHSPSGSLILTDLCFNLHKAEGWFGAKLMLNLHGIYKKFAVSRLMKLLIGNKKEARSVIDSLYKLPMTRVLVNHGEPLEENCQEELKKAFHWL